MLRMLKRRRVMRLLLHPLWARRSTNWIAKRAKVSWALADRIREQLGIRPVEVLTRNGRKVRSRRNGKGVMRAKCFLGP